MFELKTIALMLAVGAGLFAHGGSGAQGLIDEIASGHHGFTAGGTGDGNHSLFDGGFGSGGVAFLADGGSSGSHGIYANDGAVSHGFTAGPGSGTHGLSNDGRVYLRSGAAK